MTVVLIAVLVFFINIPFGVWRKTQRKFSLYWFIAIHLPVLISIGLRYLTHIEFKWGYLIIFISVFFAGQTFGKYIHDWIDSGEIEKKCTNH